MKNTPIRVCAKTGLQQKVGELVLSVTSCPTVIICDALTL